MGRKAMGGARKISRVIDNIAHPVRVNLIAIGQERRYQKT